MIYWVNQGVTKTYDENWFVRIFLYATARVYETKYLDDQQSKFVHIDSLHIEIGNIGVLVGVPAIICVITTKGNVLQDIIKLNQNDLPTSITFAQADKDTVTVTSFSEPSPKVTPGVCSKLIHSQVLIFLCDFPPQTPTTYQCGVNATCPELNEVMTVTNVADIPTETVRINTSYKSPLEAKMDRDANKQDQDYIAVINNYRISRFNPTDAAVSQISNPSAPEVSDWCTHSA